MYRKERMASVMQDLLAREIEKTIDPDGALITVMGVSLDDDLEKATVSVAVYPDEKRDSVVRQLNRRAPQLAYFLLKKMQVRKVPLLEFA